MARHDIIVIGASAGGIEALNQLVQELPADLPASIFVVVHFPSHSISYLPKILARSSKLPVDHARDGEEIQPGRIYLAPPDYHLILNRGSIHLSHGPRQNSFRPAIDPLFRSAAATYGGRVVGVVLSGTLSDGAFGLQAIQQVGGVTIVQDPQEAIFSDMPLNALNLVQVDYVQTIHQIAQTLSALAGDTTGLDEELEGADWMSDLADNESNFVQEEIKQYVSGKEGNHHSVLTCPECGGVVWELLEGDLLRFRCHVGHAYSSESMLSEQAYALEAALWTAVRAMEERAALLERLANRALLASSDYSAVRFRQQAQEVERQADLIRLVLMNGKAIGLPQPTEDTISAEVADDQVNATGNPDGTDDQPGPD